MAKFEVGSSLRGPHLVKPMTTRLKLIFDLPLPPALNHAYRSAVSKSGHPYSYKPGSVKRWQQDAVWQILAARKNTPTLTGKVRVEMTLLLTRERDIDSSFKVLFDAMQEARVFNDDRQITELRVTKVPPSENTDKCAKVQVYVIDLGTTPNQSKGGTYANAANRK